MSHVSCLGLSLSVIGLLGLGVSGPGYRLGLWGFKTGITLVKYAGYTSVAALVVCLVGLALWQSQVFPQGVFPALAGLVIGGFVLGLTLKWKHNFASVPYIHDITTDLDNPPAFDAVVALRGETSNPLDRAEPADLAELQAQAYPDLKTLEIEAQPGKVYEAALETARGMGWEIVASNPEQGLIEATATTRVMNFKDDIAIRVVEAGEGAAVDVRSVSRVGISDMGANANRIRTYLHALKVNLGDAG